MLVGSLLHAGVIRQHAERWMPTSAFILHRTSSGRDSDGILARLEKDPAARFHVVERALAADMLPGGTPRIFVDVGSTFLPLIQSLLDSLSERDDIHQLSVVTASLPVAVEVLMHANQQRVDLHLIGGPVTARHSCAGPADASAILAVLPPSMRELDLAFLGASAIDLDSGGIYSDITDVHVTKQWAASRAKEVAVLISQSKLRSAHSNERVYASLQRAPSGRIEIHAVGEAVGVAMPRVRIFSDVLAPEHYSSSFAACLVPGPSTREVA
jgi:hypothetical protein